MRNMSFALTTEQFRQRTKTVTRRLGWTFLKPGDLVMGVKKARGLRPGEQIERLGVIKATSVDREQLIDIVPMGREECAREGFPDMPPADFVRMFCNHMGCGPYEWVTRIEFEYVDDPPPSH